MEACIDLNFIYSVLVQFFIHADCCQRERERERVANLDKLSKFICFLLFFFNNFVSFFSVQIFLQHLLNVSFEWNNENILFDQNGDPPGRYDIMNFQKKENGSYSYEMIGQQMFFLLLLKNFFRTTFFETFHSGRVFFVT